jgi:hypothetical protein
MAIAILATQILILQRHYSEKLSEQAVILHDLIDLMTNNNNKPQQINELKNKIFNSSQ